MCTTHKLHRLNVFRILVHVWINLICASGIQKVATQKKEYNLESKILLYLEYIHISVSYAVVGNLQLTWSI